MTPKTKKKDVGRRSGVMEMETEQEGVASGSGGGSGQGDESGQGKGSGRVPRIKGMCCSKGDSSNLPPLNALGNCDSR